MDAVEHVWKGDLSFVILSGSEESRCPSARFFAAAQNDKGGQDDKPEVPIPEERKLFWQQDSSLTLRMTKVQ